MYEQAVENPRHVELSSSCIAVEEATYGCVKGLSDGYRVVGEGAHTPLHDRKSVLISPRRLLYDYSAPSWTP